MTKNLQSSHQVLDCSRLLHAEVFPEFSSKKFLVIQFFISTMHSVSFANWYVSSGRKEI